MAVPNGAYLSGTPKQRAIRANRMKAEGMIPGASDLILFGLHRTYFFEAKTTNGKLSKHQRLFKKQVDALGYEYFVFRSFDQFKNTVNYRLNEQR